MGQKKKLVWADNLRVASTIGVIAVHASAAIPPLFGQIPQSIWWTGNILDCVARFCVPVFLMLSGALLLNSYSPPAVFLRKRFSRILFPFIFWCLTYSLLQVALKTGELWQMSALEYLRLFWAQLLGDDISYHFWYVYMILGLYVVIPFIGGIIRRASHTKLLAFTGFWFLMVLCLDLFARNFKVPDVLRYFGYLPLGYFLANKDFRENTRLISITLITFGLAITTLGTFWLSARSGEFNASMYGYASPNILIYSIGVFMLFKSVDWAPLGPWRSLINKFSYGIYLVHVLVLSQVKLPWLSGYPLVGIPLTIILCLSVSGLLVFLINKLPGGKYISG